MHQQKTASLPRLPTELIENISNFFTLRSDIASLRLSCRELYAKAQTPFADFFFNTVEIDLSWSDIARLHCIARRDELCKRVRTLCIRPKKPPPRTTPVDIYMEQRQQHGLGHGLSWKRDATGALEGDIPVINDLCELFETRLTRCMSFRVCQGHRDFLDETCSNKSLTSSDAVAILLRIIAVTGVAVQSFELNISRSSSAELQESRLQPSVWDFGEFASTWSHSLTRLTLVYPFTSPGIVTFTARLITTTCSLNHLTIHGRGTDATALAIIIAQNNISPSLRHLTLMSCEIAAEILLQLLLVVHHSIESLILDAVQIKNGTWYTIFDTLKTGFPSLKTITLYLLREDMYDGHRWAHRITFCGLRDGSISRGLGDDGFEVVETLRHNGTLTSGVRYKGNSMNAALEILAARLSSIKYGPGGIPIPLDGPGRPDRQLVRDFSREEYLPEDK